MGQGWGVANEEASPGQGDMPTAGQGPKAERHRETTGLGPWGL